MSRQSSGIVAESTTYANVETEFLLVIYGIGIWQNLAKGLAPSSPRCQSPSLYYSTRILRLTYTCKLVPCGVLSLYNSSLWLEPREIIVFAGVQGKLIDCL